MAKKVKAPESLEEVKESVVASPEPLLTPEAAEAVVSGEVALEMEVLPETIKGRKVVSVEFYNDLHQIKDEDRTTYSLPQSEFDQWKAGKLFA